MHYIPIALVIGTGLLLASCGQHDEAAGTAPQPIKSSDPVVGMWRASVDQIDQVPPVPDAEAIKYSMHHPTLNLKADHTFDMRIGYPSSGSWQQSGQQITLTYTNANGMDVSANQPGEIKVSVAPQVATLSADNKSLTLTGDRSITFVHG